MPYSDNQNIYHAIGLMSGTSLDGLDIAHCVFQTSGNDITYKMEEVATIPYPHALRQVLANLENASLQEFFSQDRALGKYFGTEVRLFIDAYKIPQVDFIASHGHTILHMPSGGYTVQIGHGAAIAAAANLPVICDFRSLDVALGGQGAPLVPIGDLKLFPDFDFCLNLGGIANISYRSKGIITAYDICPVNMLLNRLAGLNGLEYDKDGNMAAIGNIHQPLLTKLNELAFYHQNPPKSLGKEWVEGFVFPLLENKEMTAEDKLATVCEHIAIQISDVIRSRKRRTKQTMLVTGGGAFNLHLMRLLKEKLAGNCNVIIPDEKTVKFKEALIFALLGLLRWKGEPNCLKSVTGASADSIGGCIYIN